MNTENLRREWLTLICYRPGNIFGMWVKTKKNPKTTEDTVGASVMENTAPNQPWAGARPVTSGEVFRLRLGFPSAKQAQLDWMISDNTLHAVNSESSKFLLWYWRLYIKKNSLLFLEEIIHPRRRVVTWFWGERNQCVLWIFFFFYVRSVCLCVSCSLFCPNSSLPESAV